jgi:hypothetical protein
LIIYRSPFFKVQKLKRAELEDVEFGSAGPGVLKRVKTATIRAANRKNNIKINTRVFSEEKLQRLLGELRRSPTH